MVGSLTNHNQTQCFSTHLTTFAGGFIVLPAPVNWKYVFANADFAKNKTIYITLMVVCVLYVLFMIFARRKDNKDLQKVRREQGKKVSVYVLVLVVVVAGSDTPGRQSEERRVSVSADRVHWPSTRRGNEIEGALHRGW